MIGVLVRRPCDNTETLGDTQRRPGSNRSRLEQSNCKTENTSDCWPPTEAEREAGRPVSRDSRGNKICQLLDFGLLSSITVRE